MVSTTGLLQLGLLGGATLSNLALAVYASRQYSISGAREFAIFAAGGALWTGSYAVSLLLFHRGARLFMESVQWIGVGTSTLGFLLFALTYTGHDEFVSRRVTAALAAPPALAVLVFWLNPAGLVYRYFRITPVDGLAQVDVGYSLVFWLLVLYSYFLVFLGSGLLLRLVVQSEFLYTSQSGLILAGVAAPFVGSVWDLFVRESLALELMPLGFLATGLLLGVALFRGRLLDVVPATRRLGRTRAIGQLEEGVVVVDEDRRIVYCNEAAATVFDSAIDDAIGRDVGRLVDQDVVDFGPEAALAEITHDDRVYEVRTSPIDDRRGQLIGHTLVLHDVTVRKRRELQLAEQRDDLARVESLNSVIRSVIQALVSASSRDEINRSVAQQLADSDRFRRVCVGDLATWTGDADRWLVAGDADPAGIEADVDRADLEATDGTTVQPIWSTDEAEGTAAVVPVAYGRTIFGAFALETDRSTISEREQAVLGELGETVGLAINAVENRQLLSADTVVELELACSDDGSPLVAATEAEGCLSLAGLVPNRDGRPTAFLQVDGGDPAELCASLDAASAGPVRVVDDSDGRGPIEWQLDGQTVLGTLLEFGTDVSDLTAADGTVTFEVRLASTADLRALTDHLDTAFPDTTVLSKREGARATDSDRSVSDSVVTDLTDRQSEALEAAYRAGYFDWPREAKAEEVAGTLDITAPTLTAHLRKAEATLLEELFDSESRAD